MTRRTFLPTTIAVTVALLFLAPAFAQVPPVPHQVNVEVPFQGLQTIFAEDFEAGDGGFTVIGDDTTWEHGIPDDPPLIATGQGPNVWGTNLTGDYEFKECGFLQSPSIDLPGPAGVPGSDASIARLGFQHWLDIDTYDGAAVFASTNGADWTLLQPKGGYQGVAYNTVRTCFGIDIFDPVWDNTDPRFPTTGDGWRSETFDLTPFLGETVEIRWAFASSALGPARGWYVDDVFVQVGAGARSEIPVPEVPQPSVDFTPLATVYREDFEMDDGGWQAEGDADWRWGPFESPPLPQGGSLRAWSTNPDGAHPSPACGSVTSPDIAIPGLPADRAQTARLSFDLWRHSAYLRDGAILQASNDGGQTWYPLTPEQGYDNFLHFATQEVADCLLPATTGYAWTGPSSAPDGDAWDRIDVDVSAFAGSDTRFRFLFASSEDIGAHGIYINDVTLQIGAGVQPGPFPPTLPAVPAPGWQIEGERSTWEYGPIREGPSSALPAWGTNLNGDYNAYECSAIVSPPIATEAIPGLGRLTLSFEHHLSTYFSQAGGIVQVSDDGGATWDTVTPVGGYDRNLFGATAACLFPDGGSTAGFSGGHTGPGFDAREVRLTDYDGDIIQVRFAFGASSETAQDVGWYIRAVNVHRGLLDVPITPASLDDPSDGLYPPAAWELLHEKADGSLRAELDEDPARERDILVMAPGHQGLQQARFADRDAAVAELERRAAPALDAIRAMAEAAGGTVLDSHPAAPALTIRGDAEVMLQVARSSSTVSLTGDSDDAVWLVEPIESDESMGIQNTEGRNQLEAEDMWALGFEGEGITVSVIDTGIDGRHEAFKHANGTSRIVGFKDFVNHREDAYDDHGHGTHVAGSAAGSSVYDDPVNGTFEETGVAPKATLLGVKFLDSGGRGSLSDAIGALEWSFENGANVTSNSWGSPCGSTSALLEAVKTYTDLGMASVFAAGNSGPNARTVGAPACSESAISVGAIDANENIAWFSSRGECRDPSVNGDYRICPEVVAKGVQVRSAIPRDGASFADPGGYHTWDGTSMATPQVAGAVVLAEEMKRHYTGTGWNTTERAEQALFRMSAKDLGVEGPDNDYGWGLPKLGTIHAFLDDTNEPRITHSFGISSDLVRHRDETRMHFSVRNLGGTEVNGDFYTALKDPAGDTTVLRDVNVDVGLLEGEAFMHLFTVDRDTLEGTYTFEASFAYTWTDENGTLQSDLLAFDDTFDVRRVTMDVTIDGLEATVLPALAQAVTVAIENTGNEGANGAVLEFTVPDRYLFAPADGWEPTDDLSRYADPAPDDVKENKDFGRVTLVYDIGSMAVGESFSFSTRLAPTTPGEYRSVAAVKFQDGGSNAFAASATATQEAGLP